MKTVIQNCCTLLFVLTTATPLVADPNPAGAPPPSLETMRLKAMKAPDPKAVPLDRPEILNRPRRDLRQPHWAQELVINTLRGKAQEEQRTNPDRDLRPPLHTPESPLEKPKSP